MQTEDIVFDAGTISEALNRKVDLPTNPERAQDQIDYIVDFQRPTADNSYTWYRKYKSGWVEQGGGLSGDVAEVSLPVKMADTNYIILTQWSGGKGAVFWANDMRLNNITTTSFRTNGPNNANITQRNWYVCGQAA